MKLQRPMLSCRRRGTARKPAGQDAASTLAELALGSSSILELSLSQGLVRLYALAQALGPSLQATAAATSDPKALLACLSRTAASFSTALQNGTGGSVIYWLGALSDSNGPDSGGAPFVGAVSVSLLAASASAAGVLDSYNRRGRSAEQISRTRTDHSVACRREAGAGSRRINCAAVD